MDDNVFASLLDGTLSDAERERAMAHVDGCSACFRMLTNAAQMLASEPAHTEDRAARTSDERLSPFARFGRYVILGQIGEGGMGLVYAAYDPELDRKIAIKLVRVVGDETAAARLVREAQAMARVSHPNLITVYEVGQVDDEVYITMEFVRGVPLNRWLAFESRTHIEVLTIFLAAGNALLAAHDAGVVHRDFKPSNVVVRVDGSPVVLDFGLAHIGAVEPHAATTDEEARRQSSLISMASTQTGARLGTPDYMSPEQHTGGAVDSLSDQFSFCIALWEALYGERPFVGASQAEVAANVCSGELGKRPRRKGVSSELHEALVRGLKAKPKQRHADLGAMLEVLGRGVRPRRRLVWGVIALGTLGAAAAALALHSAPVASKCEGAPSLLAKVWSPSSLGTIRSAFDSSGLSYSTESFELVASKLSSYREHWTRTYVDVCEATHVRGDQSAALLDARMDCLGDRLGEFGVLVDVLAKADGVVVENSVSALSGLSSVASCASSMASAGAIALPNDPQLRARHEEAKVAATRARTLGRAGKYAEATALAEATLLEAREIESVQVEAEVLFILGNIAAIERRYDEAKTLLVDSSTKAASIADVDAEIEALNLLVATVGAYQRKHDAGLAYADAASAAIARAGEPLGARSVLLGYLGMLRFDKGDYQAGIADYRKQVALLETIESRPADTAVALARLGGGHLYLGEAEEGVALLDKAHAMHKEALGENHPRTLTILHNLAYGYRSASRFEETLSALHDLVERRTAVLGEDDQATIESLVMLGSMYRDMGRYEEASAVYVRARANFESSATTPREKLTSLYGKMATLAKYQKNYQEAETLFALQLSRNREENAEGHPTIADTLVNYAIFLQEERGECERSVQMHEQALEIYEATYKGKHRNIAHPLLGLAACALQDGKALRAVSLLERALAIRVDSESKKFLLPDTRFLLAKALFATKNRPMQKRAHTLATQAVAEYVESVSDAKREQVEAWLAVSFPRSTLK